MAPAELHGNLQITSNYILKIKVSAGSDWIQTTEKVSIIKYTKSWTLGKRELSNPKTSRHNSDTIRCHQIGSVVFDKSCSLNRLRNCLTSSNNLLQKVNRGRTNKIQKYKHEPFRSNNHTFQTRRTQYSHFNKHSVSFSKSNKS